MTNALTWTAEAINAHQAAAHLFLAHGGTDLLDEEVTIGFISDGILETHEEFNYVSVTEELLGGAGNQNLGEVHGTAAASIAVSTALTASGLYTGTPDLDLNVNVKMFAIPLGSGDGSSYYMSTTLDQLSVADSGDAGLYSQVLGRNLDILNLSFDRSGVIEGYSEQDLRNNYSRTIAALAQAGRQEKTILVWAAGDAGNKTTADGEKANYSSPELLAGLAARAEELQGHSVAVVSIREGGQISDRSNHCGIAADFCIAAPGELIPIAATTNSDGKDYDLGSGTSFAAPMVSGGLIIMKKLFRDQLSNEQLVSRLFATANNGGIYANSAIYGHGLMDLGAATNPWGTPGFMGAGQSISGTGAPLPITASSLAAGPALGDAFSHTLGSQEVAAFDALGSPFWFQARDFTVPAPGTTVASRLQHFLQPVGLRPLPAAWQFNVQDTVPALETGHLSLTDGASRLTMEGPQGMGAMVFQEPGELEGLSLGWTPTGFRALTVKAGYLKEWDSLLGSEASGAFGQLSGETVFLGAGLNATAWGWQLGAEGEWGQVQAGLGQSQLIDAVSPLSTSAFRLQASRPFPNGSALSFSLRQPLRVESGAATLSLPTGRTRDGAVLRQVLSAPLIPSGRQLDMTAKAEFPWLGGDVSLGATRSSQPRHQRRAAPEWTVFTGYRSTW